MLGLLSLTPHPLVLAGRHTWWPCARLLSVTAHAKTQAGDPASPAGRIHLGGMAPALSLLVNLGVRPSRDL
jgi:uncharacterized iron-regulated membrane protein